MTPTPIDDGSMLALVGTLAMACLVKGLLDRFGNIAHRGPHGGKRDLAELEIGRTDILRGRADGGRGFLHGLESRHVHDLPPHSSS